MIKVSMNGLVVALNVETYCNYKEFLKLIEVMNDNYDINITVEEISDNKKVFYLDVNKKYKDIIDINFITQYDVYRYICDKYLTKNKNVELHDIIKAKEKFHELYKMEECRTNGEYWSLKYMLKFIDLLIDEVK